MKSIIRLSPFIALFVIFSCGGNKQNEAKQESSTISEDHFSINSKDEFVDELSSLDIPLYNGIEFAELKSEIPLGSMKDYPTTFKAVFTVSGTDFFANEKAIISFYEKVFTEKLESQDWKNSSISGTGILNFNNVEGKYSMISIIVTPSDYAKKEGVQKLTYSLSAR